MKSKFICLLIMKLVIIFSISCGRKEQKLHPVQSGIEIIDSLDQLFVQLQDIQSSSPDFEDLVWTVNQRIRKTIKKIATRKLVFEALEAYQSGTYDFEYTVSKDSSLGIFSWDSRLGGTMIDFQNQILLIYNQTVTQDSVKQNMAIEQVFSAKNTAGKTIYFIKGWGKESNVEYYKKLSAFELVDTELSSTSFLQNELSSLEFKYSLTDIDEDEVPDFRIESGGMRILIPEISGDRFIYRPIRFDGDKYQTEIDTVKSIFQEEDFALNNESTIRLIKGSEIPISEVKNGEGLHLVFEDGNEISQTIDYTDELTRVAIETGKGEQNKFVFDSYAEFIGKYKQYLFFDEGGVPEDWVLSIHDVSGKMPILSLNTGHVLIEDDNLVYTSKASQGDSKHTPLCKPEYGEQAQYFQVFTLDFTTNNPILKTTDNFFCGFAQ